MDTLKEAQGCARDLLREDPALEMPEHRGLRAQVRQLFAKYGTDGGISL